MDLNAIIAAAEPLAKKPEGSKVLFYVLGGLLPIWAVVLSAIGLSRPEFPGAATLSRGIMAISAVLVAAAMFAAIWVD